MRKLFVLLFMLVAALALTVPVNSSKAATSGSCFTCSEGCRGDAGIIYAHCRANGGTPEACGAQEENYYNACFGTTCSYGLGCEMIPY